MNKAVSDIFSRLILADKTVHVKLLGDSITHGVGGTGFEQDGPVIVPGWARNPNGYCWANRMKAYLEAHYDCTVENNACTGTNIQFVLEHFDTLVSAEDDIILCTIGTNNRHQYFSEGTMRTRREQLELVYGEILKMVDRLEESGKAFVLVANTPASAENEQDGPDYARLIHMNDIQDLYTKAAAERGFPLIRLYALFQHDCETRGIPFESLLADGLHPNDTGYDVMFRLLLEEMGLGRAVADTL